MSAATVTIKVKTTFNGLDPGSHVEFSWHLTSPTGVGTSGSENIETLDVDASGSVTFSNTLHQMTHGKAGSLHIWAREAGSSQSSPPINGTLGPCEVTVSVP